MGLLLQRELADRSPNGAGIWLSLLLGVVSVVKRDGSKNDKSLLCLGNVIGCVMSLASTALKGMDLSRQMGMPDKGAYVNIGITVGLATLSFLGWQSSGAAMPDLSLLTAMGGDKDVSPQSPTPSLMKV